MALIEPTSRRARALLALTVVALCSACTVMQPRTSPLPSDGLTMREIYDGHVHKSGTSSTAGAGEGLPRRQADEDLSLMQRQALSEAAPSDSVDNRFVRLPNPDLTMHVFPHLSRGGSPVPGYATVFPMYERVQYALPGEVAPRWRGPSDRPCRGRTC